MVASKRKQSSPPSEPSSDEEPHALALPSGPTSDPRFKAINDAISDKPPFCTGTMVLPPEAFVLFYGKSDGDARRIDLVKTSESALRHLVQTCDPASFGVNAQEVYDESYRKAGKLDSDAFATKFDLERSGLLDVVRSGLFEGLDELKPIRAEMYKLNVYSEGSFFKSHVDTPRGDDMFGSLVIIFPTEHMGGELLFRHHKKEWSFDAAAAIASSNAASPSIAYVAFFSDVEHEVSRVTSGYRVTLTYNLYWTTPPNPLRFPSEEVAKPSAPANEAALKSAVESLLNDPTFLPKGGKMGFGLRHQYPVKKTLTHVISHLKGSDHIISNALQSLYLTPSIKMVFQTEYNCLYLCDEVPTLFDPGEDEVVLQSFIDNVPGTVIYLSEDFEDLETGIKVKEGDKVEWVTDLTKVNERGEKLATYGNGPAEIECVYGDMVLLVDVGPAARRAARVRAAAAKAKTRTTSRKKGRW
ncbi:hypothetical protein JAAARDRAFT_62459 [Jaapia argillacea MUCL 33604]|uniref:Fe2OG dioxygenase domain-containing protein n=1 Tax=Jaapia argillacea MUCL 33604 TaxID=933084 RepID=A0A067P9I2_9AGAM|nr:hypothetical protein JAAARDRAFT_62459 [Jaapia argillacea MUCL 33604]